MRMKATLAIGLCVAFLAILSLLHVLEPEFNPPHQKSLRRSCLINRNFVIAAPTSHITVTIYIWLLLQSISGIVGWCDVGSNTGRSGFDVRSVLKGPPWKRSKQICSKKS